MLIVTLILKTLRYSFRELLSIWLLWIIPSTLLTIPDYSMIENPYQLKAIYLGIIVLHILMMSKMMSRFFIIERSAKERSVSFKALSLGFLILMRVVLFEIERLGTFMGSFAGIVGSADLVIASFILASYLPEAIKRIPELIPVCSVAFFIDIYSVFHGPSKSIATVVQRHYVEGLVEEMPLIDMIFLKIPNPFSNSLIPIFGVSDLIFATFISAVMLKFTINDNLIGKGLYDFDETTNRFTFYLPISLFSLSAALFIANGMNIFLPALPIIIILSLPWIIVKNISVFRLERNDWLLTALAPVGTFILYLFF